MSSLSNDRSLQFQTDDFFNYPTYFPYRISDSVRTEYLSTFKQENIESDNHTVTFSPETENYCMGMVDMVDSTKISAMLGSEKMSRYYQIFLNSMPKIINRHYGKVVKNIGDCLLYYFPLKTQESQEKYLARCLECSFSMTESHEFICRYLKEENLPCLDYRISMDYGSIILMRSNHSISVDMIGTPINMCSKINHSASTNGIVVGGDVHEMLKKVPKYTFKQIDGYSVGLKLSYPIYTVKRKNTNF